MSSCRCPYCKSIVDPEQNAFYGVYKGKMTGKQYKYKKNVCGFCGRSNKVWI